MYDVDNANTGENDRYSDLTRDELLADCGIDPAVPVSPIPGSPSPDTKPRQTFRPLGELLKTPPAENWVVKKFIPASSIIVFFGNSGHGKTFVVIDLLCHIAAGLPWCGNKTKQGPILYLAGEGQHGVLRRFKAWFEANPGNEGAINNILIRTVPAALCDPVATADLLDEIAAMPVKPVAIAIDTLARNFGPGDENSTRDMSAFVSALDALRTTSNDAAIILPHHSGHGDKSRARGSSVLKGAIDTEFCVERKETLITMVCSKMKDADEPAPLAWMLTRQDLPWADEDGVPMNSAVLVPAVAQSTQSTKSTKLTRPQRITLAALTEIIPNGEDHALIADWKNAALKAGITQAESKQARYAAFTRASEALIDAGKVKIEEYRCYPTELPPGKQSKHGKQTVNNVYPVDPGLGSSEEGIAVNKVNTPSIEGVYCVYRDDHCAQPTTGEANEDQDIPNFGEDQKTGMMGRGCSHG